MSHHGERGVALALVVICIFVLSILAAAVYMLSQTNITSQEWNEERLQARYTAEGGCNLAVHMIIGGASVPGGDTTRLFIPQPPDSGWYEMPGDDMGLVMVVVDPDSDNASVAEGNAYGVRALGMEQAPDADYTYGVETMVIPENFARFATFLNQPPLGGFYGDGYRFDGPFFANGPICMWSGSASSDDDIWFYTFELASDFYYYSTGAASNPQSSPIYANLSVQPDERMVLGEPYWCLGVDPIPFGSGEVNWQDARDAAIAGGLYFPNGALPSGTRIIIKNDTLIVKTSSVAAEQDFYIGGLANPVVWIDNNAGDQIFIKSMPPYVSGTTPTSPNGLNMGLTIGTNGSIVAFGPLQYYNRDIEDPANDIMLGLLSVYGDFIIASDPDCTGSPDPWPDPWKSVTNADVEYDCVVMVLEGDFHAVQYWLPYPAADFMIMGGYIVDTEGYTTVYYGPGNFGGYLTSIFYDIRLLSMHPPFFPQTGRWDTVFWEERPDLNEENIFWNRY